jgi:hypothetical protein
MKVIATRNSARLIAIVAVAAPLAAFLGSGTWH